MPMVDRGADFLRGAVDCFDPSDRIEAGVRRLGARGGDHRRAHSEHLVARGVVRPDLQPHPAGRLNCSSWKGKTFMCRNIRTLFNFDPPATDEEVQAASLQFVRKICGFAKPSKANAEAFDRAVDEVSRIAQDLLAELVTTADPRDRNVEAARARARAAERFGAR